MRTEPAQTAAPRIVQVADRYGYRDRQLRQRSTYRNDPYYSSRDQYNNRADTYYGDDGYYGPTRSKGKSAVIIGGSTAAGAAIGGMAGGGKGAAIGAITGAVGGLIYDRATHNKTSGYGWHQ
jgi:outer membrane lipoprotein SlyB